MLGNRERSGGFTLVELLVVIAIIGVLVGLLLPAVQAAREASRRMSCQNNLKQISLATELFQNTFGCYPPGRYQPRPGDDKHPCGGSELTWLVRILPYLEQEAAESRWDYSMSYTEHPTEVRSTTFSFFCCPSRRSLEDAVGDGVVVDSSTRTCYLPCGCPYPCVDDTSFSVTGAVGDYGGNIGDLSPGSFGLDTDFYYGGNGTGLIISSRAKCESGTPLDWVDRIKHRDATDGLSNTILAGEMHVPLNRLGTSPSDAFIYNGDNVFNSMRIGGPTVPIVTDLHDDSNGLACWGSWHVSVCQFAFGDGSVHALSSNIDTETLGNLCNRRDEQVVSLDQ